MKWNYRCPVCNEWVEIDWNERKKLQKCKNFNEKYLPPSPEEQYDAFVDTFDWPEEMEEAVIILKGDTCNIDGCNKGYEILEHKIAWSKGGKTSTENLFPVCEEHRRLIENNRKNGKSMKRMKLLPLRK